MKKQIALQVLATIFLAILIPSGIALITYLIKEHTKLILGGILGITVAVFLIIMIVVPYFKFCWDTVRSAFWGIEPKQKY